MSAIVVLFIIPLLIGTVSSFVARDVTGVLLIALLVVTPLHNWPYLPGEIMGVQGLSLYNILWLAAIASVMARLIIAKDNIQIERFLTVAALLCVLAYGFCMLWALMDIDAYPKVGRVAITRSGLIMNDLIKPFQLLMLAWAVFTYSRLSRSTDLATAGILLAGACLGIVIFVEFTSAVDFSAISTATLYKGRDALTDGMHLHANSIGAMSVYALGFAALTRPKSQVIVILRYAAIGAGILGIALSFSRSAWLATVIVGPLIFYRLSGRERVVTLAMLGILAIFLAGAIIERATYRADTGNISQISADRIESIWLPLLPEVVEHPLIGAGKFAVLKSEAYRNRTWGKTTITDPHSAYLEIVLDMGLGGATLFFILFLQMYRRAARIQHPLAVQLVALAIVGITGHSFYPYIGNYLVWVSYGLMAALPLATGSPEFRRERAGSGWSKVRSAG